MAKRSKEAPKPIFPLKHEFYESLDNYIQQAGMLADAVRMTLQHGGAGGGAMAGPAVEVLRERLDAFNKARHGDQE